MCAQAYDRLTALREPSVSAFRLSCGYVQDRLEQMRHRTVGGGDAMCEAGQGAARSRDCPDSEKSTRRAFLAVVSVLGLDVVAGGETASAQADPASERPKEGDLLVSIDSETPVPLEPKDIPAGGPQRVAWPMDPAGNLIRKGSRLNKVLLLRLDPATLTGATRERAADGVVAYSAICPHAGCEVTVWEAEQKILECSCHYSHFDPREGATVMDGPAPRALPALPLKLVDGKLAVAKAFTGRVGIAPT
jgi:rieske iron-sulfur protein